MKYKIIITCLLFIFSILYVKNGVYFIRENDFLMKTIKKKQSDYYIKPINPIITEHTIIPGINGRKINLQKSYNNMKGINEFKESLLVFDKIKPNKTIKNIYDKIIVSGNAKTKHIYLITSLDNKYCYTEDLTIKKECIQNNKYTILIHKITNNYLNKVKDIISNGIIIYLENIKQDELELVIRYIKNNNYNIAELDELTSL